MNNPTRRNLGAWTATSYEWGYPPFVSINEDRGTVALTVRAPADCNGCGDSITVIMTAAEFAALARAAITNL
jgi:hypothetical protein